MNHIMKTRHDDRLQDASSRDGTVLVIIMLMAGILLMAVTGMMALASNASFRIRRMTTDAKALNIAEAGIADMIGRLTTNYWHWQDNIYAADFADGSFHVVSRVQVGGNVLLVSTGTVGKISRVTAVELLGNERARNDSLFHVDGAILSGGDVRFRTSDFTIKGNVHSNRDITSESGADQGVFEPADGFDECFVTASGDIGELNNVTTNRVAPRELPEFDFDGYRQLALSDTYPVDAEGRPAYLEGDQDIRHFNARPTNGVIYVNGDITLRGDSSIVGTLVVNGDATFRNAFSTERYADDMPAVLVTGSIYLGNRGHIKGLIYAGCNVYIQNHVTLDGGIITVGYTEINNRTEVEHSTEPPPWDPTQPDVPPEVIIGGWLR